VVFQVYERGKVEPVRCETDGTFRLQDQREYVVRADAPLKSEPPVLVVDEHDPTRAILFFENYVGLAEVAGHRMRVLNSKLTEDAFERMLDGVVADAADLAFDFGASTSLPFERDDLAGPEVRYHALAYLRHVMLRADGGERLLGQFLQIARQPHRRMEREVRWMSPERVASLGSSGIMAVASHPERLVRIDLGSPLARTGLGRRLRPQQDERSVFFTSSVQSVARREDSDTHENRLVLHFLRLAADLVDGFKPRPKLNPGLGDDLITMSDELSYMLSFDFLADVGPLEFVPLQSSVLQRRTGYREFLGHYLNLSLSSVLADDRNRWHALLDLKDGALLYELWSFFAVKRVLDDLLGAPVYVDLFRATSEHRTVPHSALLEYADGTELVYNRTYASRRGSYSRELRPDIVVRNPAEAGRTLVLDAKLKFEGERIDEMDETDGGDWNRRATREDIYKMHTYRDAIREAVGAFVLYPGSEKKIFPAQPNDPQWSGVGAVPLVPGADPTDLRELLSSFVRGRTSM